MGQELLQVIPTQNAFALKVEIDGIVNDREDRELTGTMTFMPGKTPKGSFSVKIKSGLISEDEDERALVLKAWMAAGEEAYDKLRKKLNQHREDELSKDGQLNLAKALDAATPPKTPKSNKAVKTDSAPDLSMGFEDAEEGVPQEAAAD